MSNLSPTWSLQSFCAAPPSMILVTYILLSPGMCWFPTPPAMLKPSPARGSLSLRESAATRLCGLFQEQTCRRGRFTSFISPLGPLTSLISMMVSSIGLRRLTYSRTMEPATFRASTALLWETSDTSESFTRRMQSFTLVGKQLRV